VIEEYGAIDRRVLIDHSSGKNLGAFASFMKLVELSDAGHFMFADQDDVWLPDKVSRSLSAITSLEERAGPETPLVLFSDITVVDEKLTVVDRSLWHYQQFDPNICRDWRSLLAQNVVLGCSMIANAAARRCALPYLLPDMAHDQWVAVNAARRGKVDFIREATVLYRQHSDNHSGANPFNLGFALSRLPGLLSTIRSYRRSARVFDGVSTGDLIYRKLRLNLRRFRKSNEF
jgi:hypothetical protein